jgi:hypothetical protein
MGRRLPAFFVSWERTLSIGLALSQQRTADPAMDAIPRANVRGTHTAFDPAQFETIVNVPILAEHETTAADGRRLKFGFDELRQVCARCNQRIRETGDYAAIVVGHTPTAEQKAAGMPEPELIGFAGPWRMGLLGEQGSRQRWAILADCHIFREDLAKWRKHPRRSPELWLEDRYDQMFLDPIALLGAQAPRLDMGLLFAADRDGRQVERYQAAAAPSATSVSIPAHEPRRYQSGATGMLSPEDLQQIVQAISQTDWAQWCQQQMAAQAPASTAAGGVPGAAPPAAGMAADLGAAGAIPPPPDAGAGLPPEPAPPAEPPAPVGGAEPPAVPEPAPAPAGEPAPPTAEPESAPPEEPASPPPGEPKKEDKEPDKLGAGEPRRYAAGSDEDEKVDVDELLDELEEEEEDDDEDDDGHEAKESAKEEHAEEKGAKAKKDYAAGCGKRAKYERTGQKLNYAKVRARFEQLTSDLHKTRQMWSDEVQRRVNAERYSKLAGLRERFLFDLDREVDICRYEKLSDDQFATHCELIEANYKEIGLDADLPVGPSAHVQTPKPRTEHYAKECADKAMRWCEARAVAGKPFDYGTALDRVHRGEPLE